VHQEEKPENEFLFKNQLTPDEMESYSKKWGLIYLLWEERTILLSKKG